MAMKETASKCFIALTICDILDDMETKKTKGRTRQWIQRMVAKGYYNNIVKELRFADTQGLSDMFRMNYSTFQEVLMYILTSLCILNTKSLLMKLWASTG